MLNKIRIILVEPSHPGNIGAAARALKNMGLERLYLVKPEFFPHKQAYYRCSRADEILDNAIVTETVDEALVGCGLVIGTSARQRVFPQPMLDPRQMAAKVMAEPDDVEIAILFGTEHSGLDNPTLQKCHFHVFIPSVTGFSSLNLAAAVQVICYEIRMAFLSLLNEPMLPTQKINLATIDELEGLYQHIESTMIAAKFLNPKSPRTMMARLRRLFSRARVDKDDLNLLRGMVAAIQNLVR